MSTRSAVLAVAVVMAGCGADDVSAPAAAPEPAVQTSDYVATSPLARGASEPLFVIPALGRFRATCTDPAQAEIAYRAGRATATQLVTTERRASSNGRLDPGEHVAVAIGHMTGPRVEWQVALFTKARVEVATASFTVGPRAGTDGCVVSGKAEVAERQR